MAGWLLTCNPQKYDIQQFRTDGHELSRWTVGRYREELSDGDPFALWFTGADGGVFAYGQLTGVPVWTPGEKDDSYWTEPRGARWVVPLRVDRWLERTIPKELVQADPVLASSTVFTQPWATNPHRLDDAQWEVLRDLIAQAN